MKNQHVLSHEKRGILINIHITATALFIISHIIMKSGSAKKERQKSYEKYFHKALRKQFKLFDNTRMHTFLQDLRQNAHKELTRPSGTFTHGM